MRKYDSIVDARKATRISTTFHALRAYARKLYETKVDFHCCAIFTCVMHVRSRVNVKVEPRSTFTFMGGLSYIASISFTRVNFPCVCTEKLREINPKGHFLRVSGKTFLKHPRSSKFVCVKSSLQFTCKFISTICA